MTGKTEPEIGTREQWQEARLRLLEEEKDLTRRCDDLARKRQQLPWVRIDKEYCFENADGGVSLAGMFEGRSQLLIYHFMFGPEYATGCASCSSVADGFDRLVVHLNAHDVTLAAVSRAPYARLLQFQRRMGWTFPWASSYGGDFHFDFGVGFTQAQQDEGDIEYNYRREPPWPSRSGEGMASRMVGTPVGDSAALAGTDVATYTRERPGMSAFVLRDGVVHHTYSTFARGLDGLWSMYQWLDRAPLGRNETGIWLRHRDSYGSGDGACPACAP